MENLSGVGLKVLNGMEVDAVPTPAGQWPKECKPVTSEITYGLERLANVNIQVWTKRL